MTDDTETQDTPDPFDAGMTVRIAALRVARRTLVGGEGDDWPPDPVRVLEIARWIVDGDAPTAPLIRPAEAFAWVDRVRPGSELVVEGTPYYCSHCKLTPSLCWAARVKCCPDCDHVWRDVPKDVGQ